MKKEVIVRAWKDPAFRAGLSPEERAELPENPSGEALAELDESGLRQAVGGIPPPTAPIICQATEFPFCINLTEFRACTTRRGCIERDC